MNYNIAIDGPAGAGKSTIARLLAKKLNYVYIDTGAMYRATALYFLQNNLNIKDEEVINKFIHNIVIKITYCDGLQRIILNDTDVTGLIRTEEVGNGASVVSTYKLVRERMVLLQQQMAKNSQVIMDGRDIGTVVLPDAFVKIYLTASVEERANRRYKELTEKGVTSDLAQIKEDIIERDYRDTHRENSPLKQANDAVLIDCSNLKIDEVIDKIMEMYNNKKGNR